VRSPALAGLALVLLATTATAHGRKKHHEQEKADATPGAFDYYVLSLSWSPSFCAQNGEKSPEQCSTDKHFGFVVHGLWPQNEKGWPEKCSTVPVTPELVDSMLDVMPSAKLVAHEWEKHGTCSGLEPQEYFALIRKASAAVKRPIGLVDPKSAQRLDVPDIEDGFIAVNPGLVRDGISVYCKKTISEIRICFDKSLHFRPCGKDTGDRCDGPALIPPVH
jgi:ribonuclease T2